MLRLTPITAVILALAAGVAAPTARADMAPEPVTQEPVMPDFNMINAAKPVPGPSPRVRRAPEPTVTVADVKRFLRAARKRNLAAFHAYVVGKVYPDNTFSLDSLNVWRDDGGHYCAAATMVRATGGEALADKVAEQDNFIRLRDVTDGPLLDWMLTSGLTQEEVAMIQKPMPSEIERISPRPVVVTAMKAKATKQLYAAYKKIERDLKRGEKASLEKAAVLLMQRRPELVRQMLMPG